MPWVGARDFPLWSGRSSFGNFGPTITRTKAAPIDTLIRLRGSCVKVWWASDINLLRQRRCYIYTMSAIRCCVHECWFVRGKESYRMFSSETAPRLVGGYHSAKWLARCSYIPEGVLRSLRMFVECMFSRIHVETEYSYCPDVITSWWYLQSWIV